MRGVLLPLFNPHRVCECVRAYVCVCVCVLGGGGGSSVVMPYLNPHTVV